MLPDKSCLYPVQVWAQISAQGDIRPLSLKFQGYRYPVSQILDQRPANSLKTGGQGWRYLCLAGGVEVELYFDGVRWLLAGHF